MLQVNVTTQIVRQQSALDDYLEKAAEIIAAQTNPASTLAAARARLFRKVQEFDKLAHEHLARQKRAQRNSPPTVRSS